jgi:hypothetical protein
MNARSNPAANNHAEHFEKLGRERDALLQTASGTDCQRENSVQRLEQLRATQKKLSDEMHTTQGNLGVIHREYAMWKNEKGRLQNVLETERVQLEQCSEESKALQVDQSKHKREFCKAMEALNTELNDLLMQQEDIRMQKMISVESVPALLEYFRKKELTQSQDSEEAKASLLDCLQMAVDTLKTATVRYLNQGVIKNELEDSVQMLRARALVTSDKDDSQKVCTTAESPERLPNTLFEP